MLKQIIKTNNRKRLFIFALLLLFLSLSLSTLIANAADKSIKPLPLKINLDLNKVKLGNMLFHDKKLSVNGTVSCSSCHDLKTGGVDRLKVSKGVYGRLGNINSPTVYNSGFNFRQFWDGRAATLEDQIDGPLNNPKEMGSSWAKAITYLKSKPYYVVLFKKAFPEQPISQETISRTIADFERFLVTPSRFDDYLRGDKNALSANEKEGYKLFQSYKCTQCHNGVNIGGNSYQKFSQVHDYYKDRGNITEADLGRYNVTKNPADKYYFKVPTLRNVVLTWPYFHDASTSSLVKAVQVMGKYQLGRNVPYGDAELIATFLRSLTGKSFAAQEHH